MSQGRAIILTVLATLLIMGADAVGAYEHQVEGYGLGRTRRLACREARKDALERGPTGRDRYVVWWRVKSWSRCDCTLDKEESDRDYRWSCDVDLDYTWGWR